MFRLPRTLWTHMLAELWRLLLLTTGILVAVIAFAMAVQLLAAGKIGPGDLPKLMALASVPMLQYALPFAAGFSATLAYHRMTQDLEVTAASAGGIGHRTILAPALVTGVVLAGALALLNEQVIPRFLRGIERMVTDDAIKMMVKSIERGEEVAQGDILLTAERVFTLDPPPGAADYLVMEGVLVLELAPDASIKSEAVAELARVWYFQDTPIDGEATVAMRLENVVSDVDGESFGELDDVDLAWRVQDAFTDDPKFLTFGELRRLRDEPARMNFIESRRRTLAAYLGARLATEQMHASLETTGAARLTDADGRFVTLRGARLAWSPPEGGWSVAPAQGAPVVVEFAPSGGVGTTARFEAERAFLRAVIAGPGEGGIDGAPLSFTLELRQYVARAAGGGAPTSGTRTARLWANLTPTPDPLPRLLDASTEDLLAEARPRATAAAPDPAVEGPYLDLTRRLERLGREITSKQHERFAMAAACLVMVLTGAVTAMRLGKALPLTVYLWSFFPALAAIITIASGQQIVYKSGDGGLIVLWGGVAGLVAYTFAAYRSVARR